MSASPARGPSLAPLLVALLFARAASAAPAPSPSARTATAAWVDTSTGADCADDGCEEAVDDGEADTPEAVLDDGSPPAAEREPLGLLPLAPTGVDRDVIVDPREHLEIGKAELLHDLELDAFAAQELLDDVTALDHRWSPAWPEGAAPSWDIPIDADEERVGQWIKYFTGAGRERFRTWLARLTRFAPLFWPVLEAEGLPRDTIFLAMIESGFSTRATSWASAAGPWQFMPDTGRHFGLEVSFWVDERRDFERSTVAAARYLRALYDEFGEWPLAWAGYNTGEGRIRRAVKRLGSRDFWAISRTRMLYRETKHYVPKLMAAAIVAKQPGAFGFEAVDYLPPLEWEVITVTIAVDLAAVAKACGPVVRVEDLEALNPALYRGITPPGREWPLRVPSGLRGACALGLYALGAPDRLTYRLHRVRRGDTVEGLAKQYKTTAEQILKFNHLEPKASIAAYTAIVVPFPALHDAELPIEPDTLRWSREPPFTPMSGSAPAAARVHRVRSGDTLWKIGRRYGVTVQQLRGWNGLGRSARLRIGQMIRIGR